MGIRYGGRKKGTPNKKTQDLLEMCEQKGVNPFEVLLDLCKNADPNIKMNAAKEVCQYILPKRKAIEQTTQVSGELKVGAGQEIIEEFRSLLSNKFNERRPVKESDGIVHITGKP